MDVTHVFVNDYPLAPDEWAWEDDVLRIEPSAFSRLDLTPGDTCQITYRFTDPAMSLLLAAVDEPVLVHPRQRTPKER